MPASALRQLRYYAPYVWRFAVLRRSDPLIYGLAITDRCTLSCEGCRVSNTGRPDMSWRQITDALASEFDPMDVAAAAVKLPLAVKVGEKVLFGKYSGQEYKDGTTEYVVLKEEDIIAVLDK